MNLSRFLCLICICLLCNLVFTQEKDIDFYLDYIWKATDCLDPIQAQKYLDSIPKPLEEHIPNNLHHFYGCQGHTHGRQEKLALAHKYYMLARDYSIQYEDYGLAGHYNIQLFRCTYPSADENLYNGYLKKAGYYFEKSNNIYGLYEIELLKATMKRDKGDYSGTIEILLPNIEKYKEVLFEDGYLYMDATVQLAQCYIKLGDIKSALKYYALFQNTKEEESIVPMNYNEHEGLIKTELASYYFNNNELDSCYSYLNKAQKNIKTMSGGYKVLYYSTFSDYYKEKNNLELAKHYLDSIQLLDAKIFNDNVKGVISNVNEAQAALAKLKDQRSVTNRTRGIVLILVLLIVFGSLLYYVFYIHQANKINKAINEIESLNYIKSNNKKLTLKMKGLESYIENIKKQIKDIALEKSLDTQRTRITNLYSNINANSATILDKSSCHLELINELNVDFFKQIKTSCPDLNNADIIICYYILIGFTNKEISVFLNTSIRSIESRRFRISKKMGFDRDKLNLLRYLQKHFGDTVDYQAIA